MHSPKVQEYIPSGSCPWVPHHPQENTLIWENTLAALTLIYYNNNYYYYISLRYVEIFSFFSFFPKKN